MGIEGDDARVTVMRIGAGAREFQQCEMATVNAVEIAQRNSGRAQGPTHVLPDPGSPSYDFDRVPHGVPLRIKMMRLTAMAVTMKEASTIARRMRVRRTRLRRRS